MISKGAGRSFHILRRIGQVHADPDRQPKSAVRTGSRLNQNSDRLAAVHKYIVGPLQPRQSGAKAGIGQIAGRTTVLHSFGIDPAHRGRGLAHMIYQAAFDYIAGGDTDNVIGALAKEGSTKYSWLGPPSRRYAMFEKLFEKSSATAARP